MAKIVKQKYTKSNGEREVYSYLVPVSKDKMNQSGINPDRPINILVQKGKLVISN